jgi:hypothetical protein
MHRPELRSSGVADVVMVADTASLQRVAQFDLPAPAFDAAPTPDGRALVISNTNTAEPNERVTRLVEVPTGRELWRWPLAICCLEVWPMPSAGAEP